MCQYETLHEALAIFLVMLLIEAEKRQSVFQEHSESTNVFPPSSNGKNSLVSNG